ncbi:xanthine dehydrogenase molybdopterin binding subunit [Pseudoroseicyclus tamaricis]|uniref:Xanthine dehydrogenase molybdopterin binding subunit n=1 Tax=Pseudoroseicyclus tamaricis TaxID=2705421 RepID=A0A6B2JUF5_9RHOB|nr:xanthine dehydrogenase molybdopterin binding subunit [Pseudoroseicyclus tamaricis]NDV02167.1 xanthine dehydrogenase molybdopterin binding subunit [Pseudoroseicyclus tamaricis]
MSVAKPLPHDSARLHVTGQATYVDDLPMQPGTLHLAFGMAQIARGRVQEMDLDAVRAAPGVVRVWTAEDLPGPCDCSASPLHDEPLLTDEVLYDGQPIFLVAATSHLAARKAARLGKITYAEETPILTIDEALAASSRFEGGPIVWEKGAPDDGIASAPRRLSGSLTMGGQEHFYLEGQAAQVTPLEAEELLVQASTQHPTEIQHKVAEALGLNMGDVRVEMRRMGGGFGGKESQGNWLAIACAVVAAATGRPARMRYDRDDDMVLTGKRHDARVDYEVGFDDDGRVLGLDVTQLIRCGWSMDLSLPVADRAMLHADSSYDLPAIRITSHRLKTNTASNTAYRGFGGPQGMLGMERIIDHIAHELGRDPVEVRRANYYAEAPPLREHGPDKPEVDDTPDTPDREAPDSFSRADEVSSGTGRGRPFAGEHSPKPKAQTTPYGMEVTDFILHEITAKLLESSDYAARKRAVAEFNTAGGALRKGLAFSPVKFGISFTLTHLNQAGALVHVYQDGSIRLNHGGTEMGQGLNQKVAQVTAARFGVEASRVRITATDTGKVPNTSATAASSGADLNGMAAANAADTIRERMAEVVAKHLQGEPEEVRFEDSRVHLGGASVSFEEAAKLTYESRVSLSASGFYKTPHLHWDRLKGQGRPFFYFAYGAAVTEVLLDTRTGENRILRTDILHDVGASLNPAIDIGQIEGAYVQGAGWLTTEELAWDGKGRLRTHAPSTYKIPACSDRPEEFNVTLHSGENRSETIYRSKAVGEPPFMLAISAFLALSNACAACGPAYPALEAPATPEHVLEAIRRARGA